MYMPTKILILQ